MQIEQMQQNLPGWARQSLNRCSLPVEVFGGLAFQGAPVPVSLDGVASLYGDLFEKLKSLESPEQRSHFFADYMSVHFRLQSPEFAGASAKTKRRKSSYLSVLRGWFFDPDGREAAVLKGWVESRFGLSPCYHRQRIVNKNTDAYQRYEHDRALGLYNTNAIETQLDLLFSFSQSELRYSPPSDGFLTLYRGVNRLDDLNMRFDGNSGEAIALLNNINSFSSDRDTAGAFGDMIMEVRIPFEKIFCFPGLLGPQFKSEQEFLVLGGLYKVSLSYF